ncbi:hypothetical protein L207DRAFT_195438 [Hyaloscypha variabilis F]|uniref:Uncharacterized protein n=1 Tax=Hyaloscypha variabilis (strain UAMH 11265 / GT02V1 / F) TaxID=1149755 RepID=A0A2J6QYQ4_HYAVF|nr:hypothetical protein L207DRAFT_195438 [Hyaloscypha variabilis F]
MSYQFNSISPIPRFPHLCICKYPLLLCGQAGFTQIPSMPPSTPSSIPFPPSHPSLRHPFLLHPHPLFPLPSLVPLPLTHTLPPTCLTHQAPTPLQPTLYEPNLHISPPSQDRSQLVKIQRRLAWPLH